VAEEFFAEVSDVCKGLIWELDYREGNVIEKDLRTYLQIRSRTIGITPSFVLVYHLHCPTNRSKAAFIDLQRVVSLAAGLQNDLIGLEKDLQNGEFMNAVAVALRAMEKETSDQAALSEAISSISRIHNECIETIFIMLEGWKSVGSTAVENEIFCSHVIAAFTESHMSWCTTAKRYKLDVE
jgi:hypothetical protein